MMLKMSIGEIRQLIREELKVSTYVSKSPISGHGLFSGQFVPQGKIISKWADGLDKTFSKDYPEQLADQQKYEFEKFASFDGINWSLAGDGAKYINHSEDPNVVTIPDRRPPAERNRVAARDIDPNEELTMDYSEIGFDAVE
jgi:hypothetical protein